MAGITKAEVITGACTVKLHTADLGLTTEDGVRFNAEKTFTEVHADQAVVRVLKRLALVVRTISIDFQQITLEMLQELCGMSTDSGGDALVVTYAHIQEEFALQIIAPGKSGGTLTYDTTVISADVGEIMHGKTSETIIPVTFEEVGDPADNTFGTWTYAA